jgi:ABC-type iron transport system FetAB ATPase subunit
MNPDAPQPGCALCLHKLKSGLAGPFELRLGSGECAAVTGPSGSGKSLFLRMIADLDPNEGEVELAGRPRAAFSGPEWRRRVVYVPAEAGWWAPTVAEHLPRDGQERARDLAGRLGLDAGLLEAEVARLSTGERQRLALIRALLLAPEVLLLDEPTSALDEESVRRFEAVVRDLLKQGRAVVMVTHDRALAGRLATARYRMRERRLSAA